MANALTQDAAARTAERVAQENRMGNEDELRLERFLKNNPQDWLHIYISNGRLMEEMERLVNKEDPNS
jgi:hypothetical protein